ncbi:hypothetical protein [Lutimonas sp.]|uniref:hypothetical protein n=1 Tax=Lutimonas sp. TaxID=1872403 RepID=UPI003D9B2ACC
MMIIKLRNFVVLLVFFGAVVAQPVKAQEMQEVISNMTEMLDLSEKQAVQVQTLLVQYRANMDGVLLKHEGEEEPDVGAMIGEIRDLRDNYRKDLQTILSKDQYDAYLAQMDTILSDMFNDLAEIRLMDIQDDAALTDAQMESLVPIVGNGLKKTVQLLFENAGGRLSVPKKIKISKSLKKIEKEQRAGMENVLTPDQLQLYDAIKEEQKQARKNKK